MANSGRGKVLCGMPITERMKPHQANILRTKCFNILLSPQFKIHVCFVMFCYFFFFFAAGFTKFSQSITLENLLISSFPEMLWQALTWRLRTPRQVRPTWILYYYEVKTSELSSEWCLKNVQGIPKTFYWIVDVKKLAKNCPKNNFCSQFLWVKWRT